MLARRPNSKRVAKTGVPTWAAWMSLLLACAACSTPEAIPTRALEDYPFRQRQAAIRVGADPLFRNEQVKTAFPDAGPIGDLGVLPIRVQIENGGTEAVQVSQASLTSPRGNKTAALSPEETASLLKTGAGWWRFFPIQIVGQSAMAAQNSGQQKDIVARALPTAPIAPGAAAAGFVYFYYSPDETVLTGAEMELVLTSASGDSTFTIPLRGRRDILGPGAPPEKSAAPPPAPARQEGTTGQGVIIRSPAP